MDKNRTILVGIIAALVGLIFVGIMVLIGLGRDVEQVTTFALIVIPIVIAAAGLGINQLNQSEKLTTIGKNVNGNSTRMLDTIEKQQQQIGALLAALPATTGALPIDTTPPMSEDTIVRLRDDAARLPSHRA